MFLINQISFLEMNFYCMKPAAAIPTTITTINTTNNNCYQMITLFAYRAYCRNRIDFEYYYIFILLNHLSMVQMHAYVFIPYVRIYEITRIFVRLCRTSHNSVDLILTQKKKHTQNKQLFSSSSSVWLFVKNTKRRTSSLTVVIFKLHLLFLC